jgi:hypothetical protein
MQPDLLDCVLTRWQPGFNDPYVISWVMVAIYILAALLALFVARRAPFPKVTRRQERILWITLAVVATFMAINKQVDLQTLLLATGRCIVQSKGWQQQANWLGGVAIAVLVLVAFGLGAVFLWSLRRTARRTALPILGLGLMAGFIAFRAAEILQFLGPLRAYVRGHWPDRILELSGPLVIIVGALILLDPRKMNRS